MREEDEMLDRIEPGAMQAPTLMTPAMARAVELARELLRAKGFTEDQIDDELSRPPGSGFPSF